MSTLPLTEQVDELLRRANERSACGDAREAAELRHRARELREQVSNAAFENAQAGATINLSDLIGAAEQLHVDSLRR